MLKNISEIQQLVALADQHEPMARVRRMVPALLAEAEKVMRTTARLSATLRRLLDARAAAHRVRLASVLRDIRQAALRLGGAPEDRTMELAIETNAEISSPMSRTFWIPSQSFEAAEVIAHQFDDAEASRVAAAFARMQRLDFRSLRRTVRELTSEGTSRTLQDLAEEHPITGGVVELLGYLQIAHDDGHRIDNTLQQSITVHEPRGRESSMLVHVPHVTFIPKAVSSEAGRKPR